MAQSNQPLADRMEPVAGSGTPIVIAPGHTFASVTDKISSIVLTQRTPVGWYLALLTAAGLAGLLLMSLTWLVINGIGIWGNNIPVGWAFDITNFVWWIGIGHAGTLISAILLLLKQTWRTSINRFAEAMTLFAVACAGIFPLFHTGRPWLAYWLFPIPNTMSVWPQFRSPLIWDVFAVSTYATVSALFWYVGLVPDVATARTRHQGPALTSTGLPDLQYRVLGLARTGLLRTRVGRPRGPRLGTRIDDPDGDPDMVACLRHALGVPAPAIRRTGHVPLPAVAATHGSWRPDVADVDGALPDV